MLTRPHQDIPDTDPAEPSHLAGASESGEIRFSAPPRYAGPHGGAEGSGAGSVVTCELDWDALEIAVERNASDIDSYLELSTGHLITITAGEAESVLRKRQIAEHIDNYLRVEPASSREQYRWMERFVGSVVDDSLRERLTISIDGKGAFRRFKDVLLGFPVERERWFGYRANLLHWHIQHWLAHHSIMATNAPPWGETTPPQELAVAMPKVVPAAEPPGEVLRRQARELIETLPAIELPTANAFLEFLRSRNAESVSTHRVVASRHHDHDDDDDDQGTS